MRAVHVFARAFDFETALSRLARRPVTSPFQSLLIGVVCAALAIGWRFAASGLYGQSSGFMILLPGVILAALAGGRIAGFTATAGCLLLAQLVLSKDVQGVGVWDRAGVASTVNFVIVGVFITFVAAALRKTVMRLETSLRALTVSDARAEETETWLHGFSELSPALLWMSGPAGECVHLNKAQRKFWGVADDPSTFDFASTLHPDDRDRVLAESAAAARAAQGFATEARYRRADGVWRILRTQAQPRFARDGTFLGMAGVNTDVTEARAAEAARRFLRAFAR